MLRHSLLALLGLALSSAAWAQFGTSPGNYPERRPISDLFPESVNIASLRNGANAQTLRVYNTFTDANNYERGVLDWTATPNVLTIGTQNAGTGQSRGIQFITGGVDRVDINVSRSGALTNMGTLYQQNLSNQIIFNQNGPGFSVLQATGSNPFYLQLSTESSFAGATSDYIAINVATGVMNLVSLSGLYDTGLFRNAPGVVEVDNGTNGTLAEYKARSYVGGGTPPTNQGSCAVTSQVGGNTVGTFVASGACAAGTYKLAFGFTAPNGWSCDAEDRTTTTDTVRQTASTTSIATFTSTTASADVIQFKCTAY